MWCSKGSASVVSQFDGDFQALKVGKHISANALRFGKHGFSKALQLERRLCGDDFSDCIDRVRPGADGQARISCERKRLTANHSTLRVEVIQWLSLSAGLVL